MRGIVEQLEDGTMLLVLSKEMYEKEAVLASAYKFTGRCTILIEPIEHSTVGVYFKPKNDESDIEIKKIAESFCDELLDQQLRLEVKRSYGNIRELIVQHAFSPLNNLKDKIAFKK